MNSSIDMQKQLGNSELLKALEQSLSKFFGKEHRIVKLEKQPSDYRSSFSLEELNLYLDSGAELSIMFKDLSWDNLPDNVKRAKPNFFYEPEREIEVYQSILSQDLLGTALYYGCKTDPKSNRYWLFLEKVPGIELYQVGEFEVWKTVARWLARFHSRFAGEIKDLSNKSRLLQYDEKLYRQWIDRAQFFLSREEIPVSIEVKIKVNRLAERFDQVIEQLIKIPHTFIHGEFYASNVLVQIIGSGNQRVCPVDWEMSGVGPSLIDLAALTAGNWDEKEKALLSDSYFNALPQNDLWFPNQQAFETSLQYCRLYLAIQWLGWFGRRKPFAPHAQDWLGEAVGLARNLGL
jgi:thiamine kinase-like enzyme